MLKVAWCLRFFRAGEVSKVKVSVVGICQGRRLSGFAHLQARVSGSYILKFQKVSLLKSSAVWFASGYCRDVSLVVVLEMFRFADSLTFFLFRPAAPQRRTVSPGVVGSGSLRSLTCTKSWRNSRTRALCTQTTTCNHSMHMRREICAGR
jgi:hypothetical protein